MTRAAADPHSRICVRVLLHAGKWFRLRGSSVCEVCEAECVGLPLRLRVELLQAQLARVGQGHW